VSVEVILSKETDWPPINLLRIPPKVTTDSTLS
jgi:hypothetical protein